MEWTRVKSSNIESVAYDDTKSELFIRFRDGGRTYVYRKVPGVVYLGLLAAKSKGEYFEQQIKGFFCYEGVSGA